MLDVLNFLPSLDREVVFNVAFKELLPLIAINVNQSLVEVSGGRERSGCFVYAMSLSEVMTEVVYVHRKLQEGISRRQKENVSRNHDFLL